VYSKHEYHAYDYEETDDAVPLYRATLPLVRAADGRIHRIRDISTLGEHFGHIGRCKINWRTRQSGRLKSVRFNNLAVCNPLLELAVYPLLKGAKSDATDFATDFYHNGPLLIEEIELKVVTINGEPLHEERAEEVTRMAFQLFTQAAKLMNQRRLFLSPVYIKSVELPKGDWEYRIQNLLEELRALDVRYEEDPGPGFPEWRTEYIYPGDGRYCAYVPYEFARQPLRTAGWGRFTTGAESCVATSTEGGVRGRVQPLDLSRLRAVKMAPTEYDELVDKLTSRKIVFDDKGGREQEGGACAIL
jgi:hypothetical protein